MSNLELMYILNEVHPYSEMLIAISIQLYLSAVIKKSVNASSYELKLSTNTTLVFNDSSRRHQNFFDNYMLNVLF